MKICFDIDDTITLFEDHRDYVNFKPDTVMVQMINKLYDAGHTIVLFTARGMKSVGPDRIDSEIVPSLLQNLEKIGVKYHELITHKPVYDWIIDDKAMSPDRFKSLMHGNLFENHKSYKPHL